MNESHSRKPNIRPFILFIVTKVYVDTYTHIHTHTPRYIIKVDVKLAKVTKGTNKRVKRKSEWGL